MDEALEAAEAIEGSEMEGLVVALLQVVGALLVVAGVGLWLFTSMGLLWTPGLLVVLGVILLTVPGVAVELLGG